MFLDIEAQSCRLSSSWEIQGSGELPLETEGGLQKLRDPTEPQEPHGKPISKAKCMANWKKGGTHQKKDVEPKA